MTQVEMNKIAGLGYSGFEIFNFHDSDCGTPCNYQKNTTPKLNPQGSYGNRYITSNMNP